MCVCIVSINKVEWLLDKQLITDENIQNLSTDKTLHLLHFGPICERIHCMS